MSVISSVEAVPNRLEQLWLYLTEHATKGISEEELKHTFSPPSLGKRNEDGESEAGGNIYSSVLRESLAIGLAIRDETKRKIFPGMTPTVKTSPNTWLTNQLRQKLTSPEAASELDQGDVPYALAWLSLLPPQIPVVFSDSRALDIKRDFPKNDRGFGITNNNNLHQCYYWGRFLGLANISFKYTTSSGKKITQRTVIPDPTCAIHSLLPTIFSGEKELTASTFLDRLGQSCPVLERGEARKFVISQAAYPEAFPSDDELSGGTSLAMLRLEAEKVITLEDRSDAQNPCMMAPGATKPRFSHIRLEGGNHSDA